MTRFVQSRFSVGYGDNEAYRDHWLEMFGCEGLLPGGATGEDNQNLRREPCSEKATVCPVCDGRRCEKHRCKCGR